MLIPLAQFDPASILPPGLTAAWVPFVAAGAALVLGLVLLVWGRETQRLWLAALGALVGWWAGGWLAGQTGWNDLYTRLGCAGGLALLLAILSRLGWALTAACAAGTAAFAILLYRHDHTAVWAVVEEWAKPLGTTQAWLAHLPALAVALAGALYKASAPTFIVSAVLGLVVPFLLALLRYRGAIFLQTALAGAAGMVGCLWLLTAGLMTAGWILPETLHRHQAVALWVSLGLWLVLAAAGFILQLAREIRAVRHGQGREGEPPEKKGESDKPPASDKKK